jgi:hypothetical protein
VKVEEALKERILWSSTGFKFSPCCECCTLFVGDSLASERYVQMFWNTLFQLHRWRKLLTTSMKMEQAECKETWAHKIQTPGGIQRERIKNVYGPLETYFIFFGAVYFINIYVQELKINKTSVLIATII